MRALVTGGAGFVGSHLVDRLVAGGHQVDVVDDLSSGSLANLASARAEAARAGSGLKIHTLDVRAPELADLAERRGVDVVFHLAARRPGAPEAPAVDLGGALNVLEAARGLKAPKVVVALDGGDLYGQVAGSDLPVKERPAQPPGRVAGAAAIAVTDLLAGYRAEYAVEFTALAFGSIYGPRQAPELGVVAAFVAQSAAGRPCVIHGDGRQTRDFVYVDDAVDALVRAATRGSGLIVNVGTGVGTSIRDLERLVAGVGAPPPLRLPARPGERGRFALSNVRARIHLGWTPWTTLLDGIAATRASVRTPGSGRDAGGVSGRDLPGVV